MTLNLALWISGVLALIAFASPGLLTIGVYLIVPGLILALAPTVLLYLAMFAGVRALLPMAPGLLLNITSALLSALLGWAVVLPFARAGKINFDRANLPDVLPNTPVVLRGHLRLEVPNAGSIWETPTRPACSSLCAALLDSPGIESVTIAVTEPDVALPSVTYRLIPKTSGDPPTLYPLNPAEILTHVPPKPSTPSERGEAAFLARKQRADALTASWAVRLTTRQTLVADVAHGEPDMTIRIVERRATSWEPAVSRVEVSEGSAHPIFRRSVVTLRVLVPPLHFSAEGGMKLQMGLGRKWLRSPAGRMELQPVRELFAHTTLAIPVADQLSGSEMLRLIDVAISDPTREASDRAFDLAAIWFDHTDWRTPLPSQELALLIRAVADPRIRITRSFYDGNENYVAPELRAPLAARILHADTSEDVRRRLAMLLSRMPSGTFRTLSVDERAILGSGTLRPQAWPLVVRLADRGEAGVSDLLQILKSDVRIEPWARRSGVMRALREAFTQLGPSAHAALPIVQRYVLMRRSPVMNYSSERAEWYVALLRMGAPIESLEFSNNSAEQREREIESLRKRAANYTADIRRR